MSLDNSAKAAKQLSSVVPCKPYKRGPNGKYVFVIAKTQDQKSLRIWLPENASMTISRPRGKQVVVTVTEDAREVVARATRLFDSDPYPKLTNKTYKGREWDQRIITTKNWSRFTSIQVLNPI